MVTSAIQHSLSKEMKSQAELSTYIPGDVVSESGTGRI